MILKTYILLLAGCVFYLESMKSNDFTSLIYLLGSYIFIPTAVLLICNGFYFKAKEMEVAQN